MWILAAFDEMNNIFPVLHNHFKLLQISEESRVFFGHKSDKLRVSSGGISSREIRIC